jgi:hypothetical protein
MSTFQLETASKMKAEILNDEETLASLRTLRKLFESCLGCGGSCLMIHNGSGGHVTLTSSAARLLQTVQITSPVLKLLVSAVENQSRYTAGSMSGALSALLIEKTLAEHCGLRPIMTAGLLDLVAADCVDYLTMGSDCPVRVSVDFDSIDCLLRLSRGKLSRIAVTPAGCL